MKKKLSTLFIVLVSAIIIVTPIHAHAAGVAPPPGATYKTHVQTYGWQKYVFDGALSGTVGQSKRLEAINIKGVNLPAGAHLQYEVQVQTFGWQGMKSDGQEAGTDGQSKRLEAIKIKLVGMPGYSVEYRVQVQTYGWQGWVTDGALSGTVGQSKRLEAIEIKIVPSATIHPTSVSINKTTDNLAVGGTDNLNATVAPTNATNKAVTWTSSDNSTATVDSTGKVIIVSAGTTTITATTVDGSKVATCIVTVNNQIIKTTSVSLIKTTDSLVVGSTDTLSATVNPIDATNKDVTWTSSDASIATVNNVGKVTAISAGSATITAATADSNKTASCTVTVNNITNITRNVKVQDTEGNIVKNAHVLFIADNNTYVESLTNELGVAQVELLKNHSYSLYIAGDNILAYSNENVDFSKDITVSVTESGTKGSIICSNGTGDIPGLNGRLNFILDSSNRTYLYADNIAIDSGISQPGYFTVGKPINLQDRNGVVKIATVIKIKGETSLIEYENVSSITEKLTRNVKVQDTEGNIVKNAHVLFIADNNTYVESLTNELGVAQVELLKNHSYSLYIAGDNILAYSNENVDFSKDITVSVTESGTKGSIICSNGTGDIPGLNGRLNFILDSSNRTYLYADNIAIDSGISQPGYFTVGKPINLQDRNGVVKIATVIKIKGETSLIEYENVSSITEKLTRNVKVQDTDGNIVKNAHVLFIADNNTYVEALTNELGVAQVGLLKNCSYSLYIAGDNILAYSNENIDFSKDIAVNVAESGTRGSIICSNGTGDIPGLDGRLDLILDSSNRTYLYADNITIDAGVSQPGYFTVGKPINLQDRNGVVKIVTVMKIKGETSLIEYENVIK